MKMEKVSNVIEAAKSEIDKVKQLNATNEERRADCNEQVKELEGENKQLLESLHEAKERDREQQLMINALTDETESLKTIVTVLQEKCSEAENQAKSPTINVFNADDSCTSDLETKDQFIEKLKKELEECYSSLTQLKLQNEELSSKLHSTRSEFSEASTDEQNENKEGGVAQLLEQLEMKKSSFAKVENDLKKERDEKHTLQKELNRCKQLLDEYSENQLSLMEQAAELSYELQVAQVVLDRVDSELTDRTNEGSELELELQAWKSIAERLEKQFEQSQTMRKRLEATLLAQAQAVVLPNRDTHENDLKISNLGRKIVWRNQDNMVTEENAKDEIEKASKLSQIDGDDQREQELLARELEEAILAHIMIEKNYTKLPIVLELMRSQLSQGASDQQIKEIEGSPAQLMGQMERVSLAEGQSVLEKEHGEKQALEEELNRYKEMLDESTECQFTLMEQAADAERQLIDELQEVRGVLERVDTELTDKSIERSEMELELQLWKSTAERLQMQLEESQAMRRRLEASLLAQAQLLELSKQEMGNKDLGMCNVKQQNIFFNQEMMGGEPNATNAIKKALKPSQIFYGEQHEQELLARELEEAILAHIMKERNCKQQSLMLYPMRSESSNIASDEKGQEKEDSVAYLKKQLEMMNDYLSKVQADLERECKEKLTVKEELNRYKDMLDESSKSQLSVMEQAVDMETKLTDELLEVHDVLKRVDSELTDKTNEGIELEFELQLWRSIAERLNMQVEESQAIRKKLEASLLAQAEVERMLKKETDKNEHQGVSNLKLQIDDDDRKEQELLARELEQAIIAHIMKERNCT